jgi:hypothetical protein
MTTFAPGRLAIVRIGPLRKVALRDFVHMKATPNHNRLFTWDKDRANNIQVGDVIVFILGKSDDTFLEYFQIEHDLAISERDGNWKSQQPYQTGNGESSVCHRRVIQMKALTNATITQWSDLKTRLGYSPDCATWMPRGTTMVAKSRLQDTRTLFH